MNAFSKKPKDRVHGKQINRKGISKAIEFKIELINAPPTPDEKLNKLFKLAFSFKRESQRGVKKMSSHRN